MEKEKFDIYNYLNLFFKRKNYLLIPFIIVSALVIITSYFLPKSYQANTLVLVQRETIKNPLGKTTVDPEEAARKLDTLKQLITSRHFIEEAMKKVGLDTRAKTEVEYEQLLDNIPKKVNVVMRRGTDIFEISFEDRDPKIAALFVNTITGLYTEYILRAKKGQAYTGLEFIKEQLEVYRKKLQESERSLSEFKAAHLGQLPEARDANFQKLQVLRNTLPQIDSQIREAQLRRSILLSNIGSTEQVQGPVNPNQAEIMQKKAELRQLLTKYTEKHPLVIGLREQIKELESGNIEGESGVLPIANSSTLSSELAKTNLEIDSLQNRKREIEKEIKTYEESIQIAPDLEQRFINLTRDYDVDAGIYKTLLTRLEEAKVSRDLERWNTDVEIFEIIDPATIPLKPISPNRPKLIFLGCILGLIVGVGFVYLGEYMDRSLKTVKEAKEYFQEIELKVLGVIPRVITPSERRKEALKNSSVVAISALYALIVGGVFIFEVIKGL